MTVVHIPMGAPVGLNNQNTIEKSFISIACLVMRSHILKCSSPGREDGSSVKEFIKHGRGPEFRF